MSWGACLAAGSRQFLDDEAKGCALKKRLPIRGGNWNNGANAGVFALNLNNLRSNANTGVGARPALGESQKQ